MMAIQTKFLGPTNTRGADGVNTLESHDTLTAASRAFWTELLFRQRVTFSDGTTADIRTHGNGFDERGAMKYLIHVRHNGKTLFGIDAGGPGGATLWGAHSPMWTSDGKEAKNASLTHVAMKPGDTDREFFAYYSADQLDFVTTYGEELSMIAYDRYGEG